MSGTGSWCSSSSRSNSPGGLVQPFDHVALGVEDDAAPAIGPAHVCHRHEERRGQPIARSDLAGADRQLAAKAHGADVEPVGLVEDACFEGSQLRHRVDVVQFAEQLSLGGLVAGGPIAADAHAEEAGPATLALRLPDGVEDAGAHALEVTIAALAGQRGRQRILGAHVLAAAPLEDQANVDVRLPVLVEVKDGAAGTKVVAGVAPVTLSTEFCRRMPLAVASTTASRHSSSSSI